MKKKLIEVSLPLDDINKACVKEKSIRHGHPSTLHLWWARRPLAACRAVLFASLVDDPSSCPDRFPTEDAQERERERLFDIIRRLVIWENSTNETVLNEARQEILKSCDGNPPPVLDPFCGGGSIPLEAQRLGLEAHGSDLNPVAVLITKALVEIPPRFAGMPPVNPESRKQFARPGGWRGAMGLAEDVRYYGKWMRDEAESRIGHLYPKVKVPGQGEATVIAWLWARTVRCPNPACGAELPLARSFSLSTKAGRPKWVEPLVNRDTKSVGFAVGSSSENSARPGTVGRRGAVCLVCREPTSLEYLRGEGRAKRMNTRLMAIVAEGERTRLYLPPAPEQEEIAGSAVPVNPPETMLEPQALGFRVPAYGMTRHRDLFTNRQLLALETYAALVAEARERIQQDAIRAGLDGSDSDRLEAGGRGATAYADAIAVYLGLGVSKSADKNSSLVRWMTSRDSIFNTFARQTLSMVWDFAEVNAVGEQAGGFAESTRWTAESLANLGNGRVAIATQCDAANAGSGRFMVSTDPPYYDNIGYADLSDFFYVWLRTALGPVLPQLFSTLLTPKERELIAAPHRFAGDRGQAEMHFELGLREAFGRIRRIQDVTFPVTVYYAFKQAEEDADLGDETPNSQAVASTGWETMLEGLVDSGFAVTGTWPMRTEWGTRMRSQDANALASSIVLVCRPRPDTAPAASRRELERLLKAELPDALRKLQQGSIAPVDLQQAAIGPGMAVFSRFSKVVETNGAPMSVRTALGLINQTLDEVLSEQESEFDRDSRWALAWFQSHAMEEGAYGVAQVLATAKDISVEGLVQAGFVYSKAGRVRLLRPDELPADWHPSRDSRLTVWEVTHHLIRVLEKEGEMAAAGILQAAGARAEPARDLAYRLYSICERKKWSKEAQPYNGLVLAWPEISRLAGKLSTTTPSSQTQLFEN
ncbi:MAG: DUF1156 domain-containing protein [Thermoanaerobaculia bacterium]|nr:DUF1156 domain-containing protein [Thermoanaerobaculia bacterium]